MSNQPPRSAQGRRLLGPAALRSCPSASLHGQVRASLGPGATVGVLGTGVPKLACLQPTAWLSQQAVRPIFINKASKTLARVQASQGGRRKTSSRVA